MHRVVVGLFLIFFSLSVYANVYANDVAELKKQIQLLQERVDELEASQNQPDVSNKFFQNRQGSHWDPFTEMNRMQEEMNRMFQNSFSNRGWSHGGVFSNRLDFDNNIHMKESKDGYEVIFDMAGLDKDKVDIEINGYSITLKGEHSRQDSEEGPNRLFRSQSYGSFMKTIPLPSDADTSKVKTEKKDDNLIITMPKR